LQPGSAQEIPEGGTGQAALNNEIDDAEIIAEMKKYAWEHLETELKNGGKLKEHFAMIFALCYLDGFIAIEFLTPRMSDDIMEKIYPALCSFDCSKSD